MGGNIKFVSCRPCRERKVRCDRLTPCKSCLRHGCETKCRPYESQQSRPTAAAPTPQIGRRFTKPAELLSRFPSSFGTQDQANYRSYASNETAEVRMEIQGSEALSDGYNPAEGPSTYGLQPMDCAERQCLWQTHEGLEGSKYTVENLHFHIKTNSLRSGKCGCQQAPTASSFGVRLSESETHAWKIYLASNLPPRQQCDLFVAYFLENINWIYQSIHIPTFRRQQELFWTASATNIDLIWLALLYTVMCISALHIDPSACNVVDFEPSMVRESAHRWFRLSRQALHAGGYEANPCLTQLQVFVESQLYWYAVKSSECLNSALAHAVRSAQALGLDREYEPSFDVHSEMRHRLWWQVCKADTFQSLCLDRQPLVQSHLSKVPSPLNCDDSDLTDSSVRPRPLDEPTCLSYAVGSVSVFKALNKLYADDGAHLSSYEWVAAIDAELVSTLDRFPWYMNMSCDKAFVKSKNIVGYDHIRWQHHLMQNTICMQRLRMHRPFLRSYSRSACWPKCINAIQNTFSVYHAIRNTDPQRFARSQKRLTSSHQIFCSIVSVAVFHLMERPNLPQSMQHEIETVIQDLKSLAEADDSLPMAADAKATLDKLIVAYRTGFHSTGSNFGDPGTANLQALIPDLYKMMGGLLTTRRYNDKDNPRSARPRAENNHVNQAQSTATKLLNVENSFNAESLIETTMPSTDDSAALPETYAFPVGTSNSLDLDLHFDVLNWAIDEFDFSVQI